MSKKNCCPDNAVTWSSILDFLLNGALILGVFVVLYLINLCSWNMGQAAGQRDGMVEGCNRLERHLQWRNSNIKLPDCDWLLKTRKD